MLHCLQGRQTHLPCRHVTMLCRPRIHFPTWPLLTHVGCHGGYQKVSAALSHRDGKAEEKLNPWIAQIRGLGSVRATTGALQLRDLKIHSEELKSNNNNNNKCTISNLKNHRLDRLHYLRYHLLHQANDNNTTNNKTKGNNIMLRHQRLRRLPRQHTKNRIKCSIQLNHSLLP